MSDILLYLSEEPPNAPPHGGVLRRNGFVRALGERGRHVYLITIDRPSGVLGRRLGIRHRRYQSATELGALLPHDRVEGAIIDGLPLAAAATGFRQLGIRCCIDVCDTWGALSSAALTRGAVELLMRRYVPAADGVLYISETDRSADLARYPTLPPSYVVSNGVAPELFRIPPPNGSGPAVFAANFGYGPNIEGLDWLVDKVWPNVMSDVELVLFGPTPPRRQLPRGVRWEGFAPRLASVYETAAVVVAPIHRGAGIKNKVIEGVAAARPVVTTSQALVGLSDLRHVTFVADTPASFGIELERLCADPTQEARRTLEGRRLVADYDWQHGAQIIESIFAKHD